MSSSSSLPKPSLPAALSTSPSPALLDFVESASSVLDTCARLATRIHALQVEVVVLQNRVAVILNKDYECEDNEDMAGGGRTEGH